MGLFGFKSKKQEPKKEMKQNNSSNEVYVRLQDGMSATAFGLKCVRSENGIDTYTGKLIIGGDNDTIIFDSASPIAFEVPSNCHSVIDQLIKNFCQTRSSRQLENTEYTYIGDIKANQNNQLFYYNEGPSIRTTSIIEEENKKLRQQRQERDRQKAIEEKNRQEEETRANFLNRLKIDKQQAENERYDQEKRFYSLKRPYFNMTKGINGDEGYDIVDTESGNILIMRNLKKFKDQSGRYMYIAEIRDTNEDAYTEYSPDMNLAYSKRIAFTMPGRLADIILNQNSAQNQQCKNCLQWLISNSYNKIDFKERSIIDIGGIDSQGRYFNENLEQYGVSNALVSKLKSLGAKPISDERTR